MNDPTPGPSVEGARSPPGYQPHPWSSRDIRQYGPFPDDPAWIDDPALSVTIGTARASLAHQAAIEQAEGRADPDQPTIAQKATRGRRKAAPNQSTFLDDAPLEEITSDEGQYAKDNQGRNAKGQKAKATAKR